MAHDGPAGEADGDGARRVAALGAPGALRALEFARAADGPFSVDEAAAALGCDRSVARRRLDRLEAAGLLTAEFRRRGGRAGPGAGRPPKLFRVAPELDVAEYPPRRYAQLVALLAEGRGGRNDARALNAAGRRYGLALAAGAPRPPRRERLDRAVPHVCALLGRLGFHAQPDAADADRACLRVATCPLRPAVLAGGAVAEIDRGMWEALAGLALSRTLSARCAAEFCLDTTADCAVTLTIDRKGSS